MHRHCSHETPRLSSSVTGHHERRKDGYLGNPYVLDTGPAIWYGVVMTSKAVSPAASKGKSGTPKKLTWRKVETSA